MTELYYISLILFVSIAAGIIYFEIINKTEDKNEQLPVENHEVEKLTKVKKPYKRKNKKPITK
jgi:hypothetical protein